jgi:predicted transcriptional regulator
MLSEGQYSRLNEIANKSDVSIAWLIRQAVQQYLDCNGNEQLALPFRFPGEGKKDV